VAFCSDTTPPATPIPSLEPPTATPEGPSEPATPRPTRTPRDVTPGAPEPTPTDGPPAPTAAGPSTCRDVLANGTFENGLSEWQFEGEVALRDGGRAPGRRAAMLLGRNAVTGRLAQTVRVPADTTALYLTYWWRVTSDEPVQLTRAYDTVQSRVTVGGAEPLALEVLSNLAARDAWLPSAYGVPATGGALEVSFQADSNGRDPSRVYLDDVALIACTGAPPVWPTLSVEPPGGTVQTRFSGRAAGLRPGERASLWLLQPASLVRFDLPPAAALSDGVLEATFTAPDTAGRWTWAVAGHEDPRPGRASFVVEGAP